MRFISRLAAAVAALFRRDRAERELDDELRAFMEAAIEARLAAGMSRADAERTASSGAPPLSRSGRAGTAADLGARHP